MLFLVYPLLGLIIKTFRHHGLLKNSSIKIFYGAWVSCDKSHALINVDQSHALFDHSYALRVVEVTCGVIIQKEKSVDLEAKCHIVLFRMRNS